MAARLGRLPAHDFRLPKLGQGGKIRLLATPPMLGSEKLMLRAGSGGRGGIYGTVCTELGPLGEVEPGSGTQLAALALGEQAQSRRRVGRGAWRS